MLFLITVSLIIVLITMIRTRKYKTCPSFIFNGTWLIIFTLCSFNLFQVENLEFQSILILTIMIIGFPIGSLIGQKFAIKRKENENYHILFREKIFWILCSITLCVMFVDEIQIILSFLKGASFQDIMRGAGGKGTVEITGRIKVIMYLFIIQPVSFMVSPICAAKFFYKAPNRKYYLLVNIAIVFLAVMHHGGRNNLILFAISYLFMAAISGQQFKLKRKTKIRILIGVVLFIILIIRISESRGIDNIFESFYAYLTCSPYLMRSYIQEYHIDTTRLGGFLSFNGFFYPIMAILNFIGFKSPALYYTTQEIRFVIENNYLQFGNYTHGMNAFLPAGAYFYLDGGYFFELIAMIAYGIFAGTLYKRNRKYGDEKSISMYVAVVISLMLSFTRLYFTTYSYVIGLIYIALLYKKSKKLDYLEGEKNE